MMSGKLAIAFGAAMTFCVSAAGAQGLGAPCQATVVAAPPPAIGAINVAIQLPPGAPFALTTCKFDLRSLARVRRPVPVTPVAAAYVTNWPFDFDKEYLSRSPGYGTVESYDTIVAYTPEPGFVGVDQFSIDLAGVKAGPLGPTRVNFVVSRAGVPLLPPLPEFLR